jgi:hypothetical protein
MTNTVRSRPETRRVLLFLVFQHVTLRVFKSTRCSLLYSSKENFRREFEVGQQRLLHHYLRHCPAKPKCVQVSGDRDSSIVGSGHAPRDVHE